MKHLMAAILHVVSKHKLNKWPSTQDCVNAQLIIINNCPFNIRHSG